jgi:hypothetical protein
MWEMSYDATGAARRPEDPELVGITALASGRGVTERGNG